MTSSDASTSDLSTRGVNIEGTIDEGYGAIGDAFAKNFADHGEVGAAFSLYVDGEIKVDIWAGVADKWTGDPWQQDTMELVFSSTKGAAAICVAQLVEAGSLSYDDTVASHWPEFAAEGKGEITVGQMMSHQAGLCAVDAPITLEEMLAVGPVVDALAAQTPLWEPASAHGYHALTYGWLAGELVRRIDGRTIGQYFAEEIAAPLGLDFYIGLPEAEESRVATLINAPRPTGEELELMLQVAGPGTLGGRALTMDGLTLITGGKGNPFNSREFHATEMPAANGITNARSLARMYAATIGEVDGVRLTNDETVESMRAERVHGPDKCLVVDTRFSVGFMLHGELTKMITDGSFGHAGAGGSLGYANPELGIGYGYVMNQMGGGIAGDPRTVVLNNAVMSAIG